MSELINIALIMNQNHYAGREYLSKLTDLQIDVISVGEYPGFNNKEEERCGNLWKPESEQELSKHFNFYSFKSFF